MTCTATMLALVAESVPPSVKLLKKTRVGSKLRRQYGPAQTPLERVAQCEESDPERVAALKKVQSQLGPLRTIADQEPVTRDERAVGIIGSLLSWGSRVGPCTCSVFDPR